ncbi:Cytochrome P450-terp, partial [Frankliniella fusca]
MRVISGSFDQSDILRFPKYFGRQCSANAVTAICKANIVNPGLWTCQTIDECLMTGNKLFEMFYEHHPNSFSHFYLRPEELYSTVSFPETEITFQIEKDAIYDGTSVNSIATVNNDGPTNYCLHDAILCFFHNFNYGVLTCQVQCIAIMKIENKYYVFDSHKRGKNGLNDGTNGTAVLMIYPTICELVTHLKTLFSCSSCDSAPTVACNNCQFSITPLFIVNVRNFAKNVVSNDIETSNIANQTLSKLDQARIVKKNKTMRKNSQKFKKSCIKIEKKKDDDISCTSATYLINKIYDLRIRPTQVKYERTKEQKEKHVQQISNRYKTNNEMRQNKVKQVKEKYQNDALFKQSHNEKMKEIMQEKYKTNDSFRISHSKKMQEKYKTDESFRATHKTNMQQKYHTNKDYHDKLISNGRESCLTAQGSKQKSNYQILYSASKKTKICLHEKFQEQKKEMPTMICTCCAQLFFKKSTVSEITIKVDKSLRISDVCIYRRHLQENESGNVCSTCASHLKKVTCLPRMDSEDDTLLVQLMRRMSDKTPYAFENVRPEKVFNAAKYLDNTPLYKQHKISLNENWLQQFHDQTNDAITDSVSSSNEHNPLEQADDEDDLTDQQETLLTSGFVADSGIKIAPGEGNMPLSLTLDEDMDVLAFPTVYGGKQRTFKVKYTPVEMAKAEARSHDRRVATNIPKVMMNFCKARIHKLKSRVNINLRKKIARYIVNRFDAFRNLYRDKNGPFHPYEVDNDFFRIELQFR